MFQFKVKYATDDLLGRTNFDKLVTHYDIGLANIGVQRDNPF